MTLSCATVKRGITFKPGVIEADGTVEPFGIVLGGAVLTGGILGPGGVDQVIFFLFLFYFIYKSIAYMTTTHGTVTYITYRRKKK